MLTRSFDIFFKRLFILLALMVFCYVLYLTRMVIVPFVAAFILAYLLNPIVTTLQKYMSRFTAILIVYAMAIALLSIIMRLGCTCHLGAITNHPELSTHRDRVVQQHRTRMGGQIHRR